jgi:hypothetical protein
MRGGATRSDGLFCEAVDLNNVMSPDRDLVSEARGLRVEVLNAALLFAVVVGGLAFVRTLIDAIGIEEWRIAGGSIVLYGGFLVLLFAKRWSYPIRALGFLSLLYLVGVVSFLTVGYLAAPALILAGQSVMASVLFGRRITLITLGTNIITLLCVGAVLSLGWASVETRFYEPTVFMNWLRVTAIFAVFAGIAVISVDVITNHLNQSLRDQAELIENLKGAMQLHEEAEAKRRDVESRLRNAKKNIES